MDLDIGDRLSKLYNIKELISDNLEVIDYLAKRIKLKILNSPNFNQNRPIIELSNPEDMIALSMCLDKPILIHVLQRDSQERPNIVEEFIICDKECYRIEYEVEITE